MEQNKEQKWYAVEYAGFWEIQSTEEYNAGTTSILDAEVVGPEQAEKNAKLCAMAPEMKELLDSMYQIIKEEWGGWEGHSNIKLLKQYEKLCKQDT